MRQLALLAMVVACGPSTAPKASAEAKIAPAHVAGPPGVSLVTACTPTGPEICFNAIDDNCNGVFDEGCGVTTGLVQFIIAWGDSPADVDLILNAPNNETISTKQRTSPGGFRLDKDCPEVDICGGQNIENIYFEGTDPPRGHYAIDVKLHELKSAEVPVKVRVGARVGSRTFGADVELTPDDEKKSFSFDL